MSIASTSSLDWVSGGRAVARTSPAVNPLALAMLWASGQRARIDSEAPIWPSRNSDVPRCVADAADAADELDDQADGVLDLLHGRVEGGLVDVDGGAVGMAHPDLLTGWQLDLRVGVLGEAEVGPDLLAQLGIAERVVDPVDGVGDDVHQRDERVGHRSAIDLEQVGWGRRSGRAQRDAMDGVRAER